MPQVPGQCIYPSRPLLDKASLQALGLTLGEELGRYMNDAQAYGECVEVTKQQLNEEISRYLEEYRRMESHPQIEARGTDAE